MTNESSAERRLGVDRRQAPTSLWDACCGRGNRATIRRGCDQLANHFVDRFSALTLFWVLLLLLLSIADGLLTLELLDSGCREVNPILRRLLDSGQETFVIGKYLLIASGLPLLVAFSLHRLYKHLIPIFVAMHVLLIGYQLFLLHSLT